VSESSVIAFFQEHVDKEFSLGIACAVSAKNARDLGEATAAVVFLAMEFMCYSIAYVNEAAGEKFESWEELRCHPNALTMLLVHDLTPEHALYIAREIFGDEAMEYPAEYWHERVLKLRHFLARRALWHAARLIAEMSQFEKDLTRFLQSLMGRAPLQQQADSFVLELVLALWGSDSWTLQGRSQTEELPLKTSRFSGRHMRWQVQPAASPLLDLKIKTALKVLGTLAESAEA
jgi:hypothetical protein